MERLLLKKQFERLPRLAQLGLAVLAVQLLFWLVIKPLVIGTPNPGFDMIEGYEFSEARLEAPNYEAVTRAQFEAIEEMPAWHCCESGYRAFRYQFDLQDVPHTGLGISSHIRADNFAIYVNETFIAGTGRLELPDHTYDSLTRATYHIPADVVQPGANQVTFVMVRDGIPYFDYFPPILGEYTHIQSNMAKTEFINGSYGYLVLAATAMVALFSLIFFIISARDGGALWMFLLATGLAAIAHYYVWIDPPFYGPTRLAYFFVITLFVQFAWLGWSDSWSRDRYHWIIPAALAGFLGAAGSALYSLYAMPLGPGYDRAGEIVFYSGIGFSLATTLRLLWNFRTLEEDRYLEAAIALLLVSLFALQVITEMTDALNMGYLNRTQPFLIIGIGIAFFARRVTLFRSSAQINELLQAQLDERTGELAFAHDREKRLVRQQALDEERQRIMRDMHDGLGSHLMSMMMMAKRGNGKHADFADGLQSVVDEMRLMIDSMDSVGESLRAALAVFKKRVVPRAEEAGFEVTWTDDADLTLPALSPREVLHVFRILQEAVTNALKHSGGDHIAITVQDGPDQNGQVQFSVADNGTRSALNNATRPLTGGRGIKNMAARAAGLGGDIDVQSGALGTTVTLTLEARA